MLREIVSEVQALCALCKHDCRSWLHASRHLFISLAQKQIQYYSNV